MPPPVLGLAPQGIDLADVRRAGSDRLSLALMDARNQTLQLLALWEDAIAQGAPVPCEPGLELPQWLAGHVAWFTEFWIARNPRRAQGRRCAADAPRLPSQEPTADRWWNPLLAPHARRWDMPLPELGELRRYLMETVEATLALLEHAEPDDDGLYFYRAALFHEDLRGEQLLRQAQALGVAMPLPLPGAVAAREPLLLPACRWVLGAPEPGFVFDVERGPLEVAVPAFEIDAQPVGWGAFVEFVDDGGYDRPELWHPEGWAWLTALAQGEGRRGPRHVEQIGVASGAVMQTMFGRPTRMAASQPALHVSWWEADAWARWAGRRLPTEVEWEIAATQAGSRGFRWGDVHEWTAGTLRPWPGFEPDPWTRHGEFEAEPLFGQARVLRGASFATRARLKWPRRRAFALPGRDDLFVGFRTCAV
ncbi:MAG TPA: SUMF1/EgtB/PvdO family nonheme iron enzyme [Ramlibacter sp.]|jgi:ergothioneine biosynthesis protein EgtB|uniref:SUMF1/EgtB/PvdO family nonheme iron enzyme n=1 Tax=Ramlibacter sp. TaxID=1917967 RepID=UPI002D65D9E1|nr:SUMF1/EgtB/PvdO family nonheme iron enzyme [Ramlibacter sp.]HZY20446.1 SUMF1/EgtB/PvdO family nonheme iron enzyme [Ramlibacter sp.]